MRAKAALIALLATLMVAAAAPAAVAAHSRAWHKRHVRQALLLEIKRHPRVLFHRRFLRKATAAGVALPLTVRLNPLVQPGPTEAPSDDALSLDLGTDAFTDPAGSLAGLVAPALRGKFGIVGRFDVDTTGTGQLGSLFLSAGSVAMSADSFPLVNPTVPCGDGGPLLKTGPVTIVDAPPLPAGDKRGGLLNWFTGDISMRLYTQFQLNSQRRASCTDPFLWTDRITSTTNSVIPIDMVGHFSISPGLSNDGRLRLLNVTFDNAVIPQAALPAFLHTCTQATAVAATDPAPSAACDGVAGDDVSIQTSVKLSRLTAEVFIGNA